MRVYILIEDLWPDYQLVLGENAGQFLSKYEGEYDVPDKLFKDYEAAREKFMELRRQLRDIVTGSDPL